MTRAINLRLEEADLMAKCAEAGVSISAIEPLASGGTHLVCTTGAGADEIRVRFQDHIIAGPVRRFPFYRPSSTVT
jgi:hypothetical protein